MNYWIFKVNPEFYRIDARMLNPNPRITWQVAQHRDQIRRGDIAFIWRTGAVKGIIAVMKIDTDPIEMADLPGERGYYIYPEEEIIRTRVIGTLTRRFPLIPADHLRTYPGLEALAVFNGFQGMWNFPVTPEEGMILDGLVKTETV